MSEYRGTSTQVTEKKETDLGDRGDKEERKGYTEVRKLTRSSSVGSEMVASVAWIDARLCGGIGPSVSDFGLRVLGCPTRDCANRRAVVRRDRAKVYVFRVSGIVFRGSGFEFRNSGLGFGV